MQAEEFYKNIQQKINEYDFQPELSDWNRQEVWQRIEQKQVKQRMPFVWWQAAAAILIFAGSFTYFNGKNLLNNVNNQVSINVTKSTPENFTNIIKSTQTPTQQYTAFAQREIYKNESPERESINSVAESVVNQTTLKEPENLANMVVNVPIVEPRNEKSDFTSSTENVLKENTFIPNKAILAVKVPSKRERIAILEIPEDDELANIPRKENKKGFLARLNRKMNKLGNEQNEEAPSINGKPNKVWAFVKESFKNETMITDTTNR